MCNKYLFRKKRKDENNLNSNLFLLIGCGMKATIAKVDAHVENETLPSF